jgi:hypothetical protein
MARSSIGFGVVAALAATMIVNRPVSGSEKPSKPLCWVQVTPKDGIPAEAYLLRFEDGTFTLRHKNKQEYTIDEKNVVSIRFLPLSAANKPERRPTPDTPDSTRRGDDDPKTRRGPFADARTRWEEHQRKRLKEIRRSGKLGEYIKEREERLRKARNVFDARQTLAELLAAHRANDHMPEHDYWRRLIESIENPQIRRSRMLQNFPPPGPGPGPGPGRPRRH